MKKTGSIVQIQMIREDYSSQLDSGMMNQFSAVNAKLEKLNRRIAIVSKDDASISTVEADFR